jgi:hypothetical protein
MKQFNKTLLAAALMVAAGSASAAMTNGSTTGTNEAFLVAFDSGYVNTDGTFGRTYNLDLGITFNGLKADVAANNGSFQAALTKDLTADTNYSAFLSGANTGNITFGVYAVGDTTTAAGANNGLFVTGNSLTAPTAVARTTPAGSLTTYLAQDTQINRQAAEIAVGMSTNTSSLIKGTDAASSGQANNVPTFNTLWSGAFVGNDPTIAFGATGGNIFYGGTHLGTYQQRVGGVVTQGAVLLAQSDIVNLGNIALTANGLTAVPLPAAVWLFGAGLMGMLRMNRRKSVQA